MINAFYQYRKQKSGINFFCSRLAFKYLCVIEAGRRGSVAGVRKVHYRYSGTLVGGTSSMTRGNGRETASFAQSRPRTPQRDNSATISPTFWGDVRDALAVFRPGRRCDSGTIELTSGPPVDNAVDNVRPRPSCPVTEPLFSATVDGTTVDVSD